MLAILVAAACRAPAPKAPEGEPPEAKPPAATGGWLLLHPPDVRDAQAPGGVWLLPQQPVDRWYAIGRFTTEAACDDSRKVRLDNAIDSARRRMGPDAKFDLDVRRAVHARCIPDDGRGDRAPAMQP